MTLTPLGDQAFLAYLPDEAVAYRVSATIRSLNPPWLEDVVPAYASVGVFFDSRLVKPAEVAAWLTSLPRGGAGVATGKSVTVPVCYERGPDLGRVAELTGRPADDVIALHTAPEYTVYAIGFVPGFPYLGYLPKELTGVARLESPRVRVEPGSVGLTGRQTGIYPLAKPGGWNLIGRTPLTIVDVEAGYFPLRVGDKVRFERIDERRFAELEGERL
jgi:inhibitor of KinA